MGYLSHLSPETVPAAVRFIPGISSLQINRLLNGGSFQAFSRRGGFLRALQNHFSPLPLRALDFWRACCVLLEWWFFHFSRHFWYFYLAIASLIFHLNSFPLDPLISSSSAGLS